MSYANGFSADQEAEVAHLLAEKRIRILPYPFASAAAVVSDVDNSRRSRYAAYIGLLVERLGLDFGDSTWLRWQYIARQDRGNAFGFFSRYFSVGRNEKVDIFDDTRTFNENVAEFHSGNVDHFHSFWSRGPRVVVIDTFAARTDGRIEIGFDAFQEKGRWSCEDFFVFGTCVVGKPGRSIEPIAIAVRDRAGTITDRYRPAAFDAPPNGREHRMFSLFAPADEELSAPPLDQIDSITIGFGNPAQTANVERVLLINCSGEILLDRLRFLRDRYNVEFTLITQHAALHFRNPGTEPRADRALREHVKAFSGPIEAYNGSLADDDGSLVFSTDADEPYSVCRVFPELSEELETRFVLAQTASRAEGFSPLELVTPSATRAGGGVYCVRRMHANLEAPPPGREFDRINSRQSTFARRIDRVLAGAQREPRLVWPLYTHLGSLDRDDLQSAVPTPYFDPGPLHELQDRVFDISGNVPPGSRIWFARASVVYDYALMLRGIAGHVERPDEDTVRIASWIDPALGKTLPRSLAQLYGLTFYVRDPGRADVRLDGEPVETLIRNPRDETGRASVTIAESAIRHTVFCRLDPTANAPGEITPEGGAWRWIEPPGEPPFGRLAVAGGQTDSRGSAALRLPLHGWAGTGTQALSFAVRIDEGVLFGLTLETQTGGKFYFGDKPLAAHQAPNATACYFFVPRYRSPEEWHVLTVPFHDLAWNAGAAAPGGPMPNHPLAAMTIYAAGPAGSGLDIGRVRFLRPRAVAPAQNGTPLFCLGGRLGPDTGGEIIYARHRGSGEIRTAIADQRGHFCFGRVPVGVYRVWCASNGREMHDRRGALVEVDADVMNLRIEPVGGSGI